MQQYFSAVTQGLGALLPREIDLRSQFPTPISALLHAGLHPRGLGTYLEVLKGEEAQRLRPFHPEGCLTSTFFLKPLRLACAPSAMFWVLGGQRHRAPKVHDLLQRLLGAGPSFSLPPTLAG